MKYTKKKDYDGTIRKVWNDDKSELLGVVGKVGDLLAEGILDECDTSNDKWMCIPRINWNNAGFGDTREEAIFNAVF